MIEKKPSLRTKLIQIVAIPLTSLILILLGIILLGLIVTPNSVIIAIITGIMALTFGVLIYLIMQGLKLHEIIEPLSVLAHRVDTLVEENQKPLPAQVGKFQEIARLEQSFVDMVHTVQQRNKLLEQRNSDQMARLQIITKLSERLSQILEVDSLLKEVVNQVNDSFGYYHTHIYLFDDARENLVMAEGTGQPSLTMKEQKYHIPLKTASIIARSARTSQIVRVDNVKQFADWLPNPLLPDTCAEIAVPIISNGQVVGVLDVQNDEALDLTDFGNLSGLDYSDESLLRSLANYIATSIHNARLFNETEAMRTTLKAYQTQYIERAWDIKTVRKRGTGRAQFSLGETTTLQNDMINHVGQQIIVQEQSTFLEIKQPETNKCSRIWGTPINLDNITIGTLQFHGLDPDRQWTESELVLIKAVIDQVAQNAESLRLVSEIQEQAGHQQLISQIGNKLRRAPNIDTLMEITVSELSQILKPARTYISLNVKD